MWMLMINLSLQDHKCVPLFKANQTINMSPPQHFNDINCQDTRCDNINVRIVHTNCAKMTKKTTAWSKTIGQKWGVNGMWKGFDSVRLHEAILGLLKLLQCVKKMHRCHCVSLSLMPPCWHLICPIFNFCNTSKTICKVFGALLIGGPRKLWIHFNQSMSAD